MSATKLIDSDLLSLLEGRDLNIRSLKEGLFGGNRRSRRYGSSVEFADFRDYMPGDDLRRVDWSLYGRTDKLYLRQYVDERRQHHRVLLDCSASMAWGEPDKARYMLQLAAVLGYLAVSGMDIVSYYALQGKDCRPIGEPVHGRDAWYLATEKLAAVPFGGDSRLERSVCACPNPGRNDGTVFLISDLLTDSDWKSALDSLLERRQDVCLIRVLSRDELGPQLNGKLLLNDTEAQGADDPRNRRMEISRQRLRAYAEASAWLENDIRGFCAGRGIRFLQLCTDEDLSRVLFARAVESEMIQ